VGADLALLDGEDVAIPPVGDGGDDTIAIGARIPELAAVIAQREAANDLHAVRAEIGAEAHAWRVLDVHHLLGELRGAGLIDDLRLIAVAHRGTCADVEADWMHRPAPALVLVLRVQVDAWANHELE